MRVEVIVCYISVVFFESVDDIEIIVNNTQTCKQFMCEIRVCGCCRCSLACFVVLYLIGGVLYMRIVRKSKGLNQIPNYDFWRDFGALQAVSLLHVSLCYIPFLFITLLSCILIIDSEFL